MIVQGLLTKLFTLAVYTKVHGPYTETTKWAAFLIGNKTRTNKHGSLSSSTQKAEVKDATGINLNFCNPLSSVAPQSKDSRVTEQILAWICCFFYFQRLPHNLFVDAVAAVTATAWRRLVLTETVCWIARSFSSCYKLGVMRKQSFF